MTEAVEQLEWLVGWHSVLAVLQTRPKEVTQLLLEKGRSDGRAKQLQLLAEQYQLSLKKISREQLEALVLQDHHQGVALQVKRRPELTEALLLSQLSASFEAPVLLLILEEVQDPHNLGACWRSAAAFGVQALVVTCDRSAKETATVKKVASGAAESLPLVTVKNLARFLTALKELGIWVVGAAGEAEQSLGNFRFPKRSAVIIGQEETGLKRLTREHCDHLVSIPMHAVSSLNLSVAAGVFLFAASTQRI